MSAVPQVLQVVNQANRAVPLVMQELVVVPALEVAPELVADLEMAQELEMVPEALAAPVVPLKLQKI